MLLVKNRIANGKNTPDRPHGNTRLWGDKGNFFARHGGKRCRAEQTSVSVWNKKGTSAKGKSPKTTYVCKNTVHPPQRARHVTPLRPTKSPKGAPCHSKTHNSADRKTTSVCFCRQSAAKFFCSAANANTVFARYRKTFCRNIFSKIFVTQRASNKNPCGAAKNGRHCCFALCAKKRLRKAKPF